MIDHELEFRGQEPLRSIVVPLEIDDVMITSEVKSQLTASNRVASIDEGARLWTGGRDA